MSRFNPVAIPLILFVAACSPAPDSSSGRASGPAIQIANQDVARSGITPGKIVRDVVKRVVMITQAAGDSAPTEWTFDADEFKQVEILDSEVSPTTAVITVFMNTRNNPGPDEDAVQVSGKLKLRYQRKGGEWVLVTIENISFRYTVGIST